MLTRNVVGGVFSIGLLLGAGCQEKAAEPPKGAETRNAEATHGRGDGEHSHGHDAGPHGGTLADWGGGIYHVEFTVDHDKREATIYVLGSDEKTTSPVKATGGKLLLAISEPVSQIELVAVPQEGEADGASSRYVGVHDTLGIVREFSGTIGGEVEGTPYAADFKEAPHETHDHN